MDAMLGGTGTNLLAKLDDEAKLKDFDKIYEQELGRHGDSEKAALATADRMSTKYGDKYTAEDVRMAQGKLKEHTGKSSAQRKQSGKGYSKALKLTKGAKSYTDRTMLEGMLDTAQDSIAGSTGVGDLEAALSSRDDGRISRSQEEIMNLARRAATGDWEAGEGDPAFLQAIGKAGGIHDSLKGLIGRDVGSLDKLFGKGAGEKMRTKAGVLGSGKLNAKEIEEMAAQLAGGDAMKTLTADAAAGTAGGGEGISSDADHIAATLKLTTSVEQVASYVDNIGAALTGNDPYKKTPGIYNPIREANK
jgi:hypothetical protein